MLGDTVYRSTTAVYDALPDTERRRLDGLRIVQSYAAHLDRMRAKGILTRTPVPRPDVVHPLARPEFSWTHSWAPGDFVIWDNSVTQHKATFDYGDRPRRLHRASTTGPAPE